MLIPAIGFLVVAFLAAKFGPDYYKVYQYQPQGPVVDLGYSKYEGTTLFNGQNQFLGIRFAAPPLGNLRFRGPQPPLATKRIQPATDFGPICYSLGHGDGEAEDCLFMNIWSPSNATEESKFPVFFWIQGGGYNTNSQPNVCRQPPTIFTNLSLI